MYLDPACPDCKIQGGQPHLATFRISDEYHMLAGSREIDSVVDRVLVDTIVVPRYHDDRHSTLCQRADRKLDYLFADTSILKKIACD
jgi:hypothetical protein